MHVRTPSVSDIAHKTVLLRVDYNVPLTKTTPPQIRDPRRIAQSIKTLEFLLKHKAKVVVISHLGRPKSPDDAHLSLRPVAEYLSQEAHLPVAFVPRTIGAEVRQTIEQMQPGTALLLENLRFFPEEKKNDAKFARELAALADVFVNDAFSAAHRSHASVVGVTKLLPSFAGFSLAEEVKSLGGLLDTPKRPFVVILGGAKISDKVAAVENLANLADIVLVGGAVANNFLKAEGLETFRSYTEEASADLKKEGVDYTQVAAALMEEHKTERMLKDGYIPLSKILYPIDALAAPALETSDTTELQTFDLTNGMEDRLENEQLLYLDIGPKTRKLFAEIIAQAGTVFWNGPMGVWENPLFARGTRAVAAAIADSRAKSVLGGGDTIAAIHHFKMEDRFSYVSAAGGAALDFLGGIPLPGIVPLLLEKQQSGTPLKNFR
jgi:3-phosphoglycerate kinase